MALILEKKKAMVYGLRKAGALSDLGSANGKAQNDEADLVCFRLMRSS